MDLSELATTMARLEARDELHQLDLMRHPAQGPIRWLFGLTSGLYFANAEDPAKREATLALVERYHDTTGGRTNLLASGNRSHRLKSRAQIRRQLEKADHLDPTNTISYYIRHMPSVERRSTDPVHDYFTAILPSADYRGGNGRVMYQTRLAELARDPDGVIASFIDACRALQVFYAVSGISLLFYSYACGAPAVAQPLLRRFPGLLYEDGSNFTLEILRRTDLIRDINWLTAINDDLLDRVGGAKRARTILSEQILLHPYPGGMVFQAGPTPRLGDLDREGVPPAYRELNEFLKPLRHEAWEYPYLMAPDDVDAMEFTDWWTRRFDR